MKSHNIFPLLVALLCIFQKRSSTHSLNAPGSPGYYQDGDFIIGGLFSLRVTSGNMRSKFGFQDTFYIPLMVYEYVTIPKYISRVAKCCIDEKSFYF